jgi:hypothetical protein
VDLELIYFLEHADLRGSICPDLEEQLEILELSNFMLKKREHGTLLTLMQNGVCSYRQSLPTRVKKPNNSSSLTPSVMRKQV